MTAKDRPWLDSTLPVDDRVEALLARMDLPEKVGQLHQTANLDPDADRALIARGAVGSSLYASGATAGNVVDGGIAADAVIACQRVAVDDSRLGIPLLFGRDVIHGHRTVVPIPLGLAAGFDPDLARRCAAIAATEAAADGVAWTFAPMLDISEEPRWGRVAESLGEAPVLAGRLGAAMVAGFQDDGSIAACAKHFVGYGAVAGGRDYDSVTVGENTLRNLHLRPFEAAVRAGCLTVMAAFNDVDGTPMHAHRYLLRDVLKGEWGFDGLVVADWNGIGQLVDQGVAADLRGAASLAIDAGVDLDMVSGAYAGHLVELVESGTVEPGLVDDAVRRVLRVKFRLGLFERPHPAAGSRSPGPDESPDGAARALAREAAVAATVLVQNNGVLPLGDQGSGARTIHLVGPFVDDGDALLGTWVLDGRAADVRTPATAFGEVLGAGRLIVDDARFSDVSVQHARAADVTVAVVGEHRSRSGEDRCISTLDLPAGQLDLLRALAVLETPLVVVVYTGRPLDLGPVCALADAVVVAWHPGIEAGPALCDVLLGRAEPRGRLPMTFPRSVGHIPTSTHQRPTGRPIPAADDRSRGRYLDALVQPALPFGRGLTYTTFEYGPTELSADELSVRRGSVTVSVDVRNTGTRAGTELVQLYLGVDVAAVTRPSVELADWHHVRIAPGRTRRVRFTVRAGQFGYYDAAMRRRVDPGTVRLTVGPDAATGDTVRLTLTEGRSPS